MIHMINIIKHIHIINLLYECLLNHFSKKQKRTIHVYTEKKDKYRHHYLGFWFSYSPKQIFINNLDLKHAQ